MLYGEKLRELREENNLKLLDLAKLLDIDSSVYGKYEREYILIPIKYLNILCNFFHVSLDYMFNFTNKNNYKNNKHEIYNILSGQRLKEFRKENKITQLQLAKILNAGQPTIANYENGTYFIATPFLYTICSKYKISADYLLGKIDNPKYLD